MVVKYNVLIDVINVATSSNFFYFELISLLFY